MSDASIATIEPTPPTTVQKVAAEAIGMFVLVFFGCGTALVSGGDYVATGLAFGLTVLVMVYAVGRISGGHFNPAVTVGAALGGRTSWVQVPIYVGTQLVGAVAAGLALFVLMHGFPDFESEGNMAQNFFGDQGATDYAWWAAFLLEALMTMIFVLVILAVTDVRNEHPSLAPLAIGLALTMIHFASINATGTSVNPARSIGVGLFAGGDAIIQLWLFILAPTLGGALAGIIYPLVFGHGQEPVAGSGLSFGRAVPVAAPGYGAPDQYQQQWNQGEPQQWPTGQYPQPYQQQWQPQQQQQPPPPPYQQPATPTPPPQAPAPYPPPQAPPQGAPQAPPQAAPPSAPPPYRPPDEGGPETTQIRPPGQ
jgi:aquaporin Z